MVVTRTIRPVVTTRIWVAGPSRAVPASITTRNRVDSVRQSVLGGITATTWANDGRIPGKEVRATAGDVVRIRVESR